MTLDSDRDEQIERIGPARFTYTNGGAYLCPQCGVRVNLKIESTIDTSTSAPGTHVYYGSGDTTVSGG